MSELTADVNKSPCCICDSDVITEVTDVEWISFVQKLKAPILEKLKFEYWKICIEELHISDTLI